MRLITFTQGGDTRIGLLNGEKVIDLSATNSKLPNEMKAFLATGDEGMAAARSAEGSDAHFDLSDVKLESPVVNPAKILAIGLNYRAHAEESGMEIPKTPFVFTKQRTCMNGPYDPVHWSEDSKALDYEGELGIIIGKTCRRVPPDRAASVIAGFCIINDVSDSFNDVVFLLVQLLQLVKFLPDLVKRTRFLLFSFRFFLYHFYLLWLIQLLIHLFLILFILMISSRKSPNL